MTIVAVDLATDRMSVAALGAAGLEVERHLVGARSHARSLVPLLDEVLAEAGESVATVARILVADGPGSFTGLRVAAALAKGLARAGGVTVATVPSLLGRAARVASPGGGLVLCATSALRGEVYAGWYRFSPTRVETVHAAQAAAWDAVRAGPRPELVAGDGPDGFLESLGRHWDVPVVVREGAHADARSLLALDRRVGGMAEIADPASWEPTYGRPAEAQAKWEREHGRPLPDSSGTPG